MQVLVCEGPQNEAAENIGSSFTQKAQTIQTKSLTNTSKRGQSSLTLLKITIKQVVT